MSSCDVHNVKRRVGGVKLSCCLSFCALTFEQGGAIHMLSGSSEQKSSGNIILETANSSIASSGNIQLRTGHSDAKSSGSIDIVKNNDQQVGACELLDLSSELYCLYGRSL